MKKLEAIIDPVNVDKAKKALLEIGIRRIETTEVKGFGRNNGHTEVYRGRGYTVDYTPEVKMEMVVEDAQLEGATAILLAATGVENDNNGLLIFPVETALHYTGAASRS